MKNGAGISVGNEIYRITDIVSPTKIQLEKVSSAEVFGLDDQNWVCTEPHIKFMLGNSGTTTTAQLLIDGPRHVTISRTEPE